jgi:hypothetical protein
MGLQAGGTLPSTTLRLSSLAATMEAFAENVKRVHYQASREADNSPQLDPLLRIVDGHYFESVQL